MIGEHVDKFDELGVISDFQTGRRSYEYLSDH